MSLRRMPKIASKLGRQRPGVVGCPQPHDSRGCLKEHQRGFKSHPERRGAKHHHLAEWGESKIYESRKSLEGPLLGSTSMAPNPKHCTIRGIRAMGAISSGVDGTRILRRDEVLAGRGHSYVWGLNGRQRFQNRSIHLINGC